MDLTGLPPELLVLIVNDRLSPEDLDQLSRTNQRIHDYLRDHAELIWKVLLRRDYPSFSRDLAHGNVEALKSLYFRLRNGVAFCRELLEVMQIPASNAYASVIVEKILQQFVHRDFLPLNAIFDDHTPQLALAKLQCSNRIDAFLNTIVLDFRVPLTEEQRMALRPVITQFLRAHLPVQSLSPILRNRKYIVTRVTLHMLLPDDLRTGFI